MLSLSSWGTEARCSWQRERTGEAKGAGSECWPDLGGVHAAEPIGVFRQVTDQKGRSGGGPNPEEGHPPSPPGPERGCPIRPVNIGRFRPNHRRFRPHPGMRAQSPSLFATFPGRFVIAHLALPALVGLLSGELVGSPPNRGRSYPLTRSVPAAPRPRLQGAEALLLPH